MIFSRRLIQSHVVPSCHLGSVTHLQSRVQPSISSQSPLQNVAYPSHAVLLSPTSRLELFKAVFALIPAAIQV